MFLVLEAPKKLSILHTIFESLTAVKKTVENTPFTISLEVFQTQEVPLLLSKFSFSQAETFNFIVFVTSPDFANFFDFNFFDSTSSSICFLLCLNQELSKILVFDPFECSRSNESTTTLDKTYSPKSHKHYQL